MDVKEQKNNIAANKTRCAWVSDDRLYIDYHDHEWGIPIYDDKKLFEFLILEGAQAGLSWITVLKKRDNYRACFDEFEPQKIALYDQNKIQSLLENPGIIRNRLKIESTITNARAYFEVINEWNTFSDYIWHFVDGKPIKNHWPDISCLPAKTVVSDQMSKDLKRRRFKFVGSTICYAFMQAVGMVNDHTTDCFCYKAGDE
ncbi:DNA-3-methyladenine glycosylase I [Legionella fallonii]|uniref:DNA-3-methyladenine glycosylase I n=1 Tax=Legionella fallonii LLAP-10 TaxID=1212491 RepID=A0A098G151_9GAMM|nr:DNA-3-methyladenine glycosylase I [Legionella fallonii]CEG55714.1 DNA-3-methyladenine glycosylase [Legionella fallonii LLAP-10]